MLGKSEATVGARDVYGSTEVWMKIGDIDKIHKYMLGQNFRYSLTQACHRQNVSNKRVPFAQEPMETHPLPPG